VIELRVLGPPRIEAVDGRPVESIVGQSRRMALLAYLGAATPRGAQRRDKLVTLFWPESDETRARAALNQALYVLRSRLGDVFVSRGNDEVALDPAIIWCDAAAFEDLLDSGRAEEALALYRGDLLDGFFISGAPGFERWLDEERQRLRQRASDGAWALADACAGRGEVVEAERWARRAADLVPGDEAVVRRLMVFLRGLGDRAAAIRAYEAFVWRLAQEYELEPSAETRALAAAIRDEERIVPAPALAALPIPRGERVAGVVSRRGWSWTLLVLAIVGSAGVAAVWGSSRAAMPDATEEWVSLLDVDDALPLSVGTRGTTIAVSPRGDVVYVGRAGGGAELYLKRRNEQKFSPIPRTMGALQPFFSPDGVWIGYVVGNTIRKVRVAGGPSVEICRVDGPLHGVSWGDGEVIVFALPSGLFRVPAASGDPTPVARPDSSRGEWYGWPNVLPGGRSALFTIVSDSGFQLAVASLESGNVELLGVRGMDPRYVAPGYLVWARHNSSLLAARFDARSARLTGPAMPVVEDVHVGMGGQAFLGVSSDALAYVPVRPANRLVLLDSLGRERTPPRTDVGGGVDAPRFTPDGRHLVLIRRFPGSRLADIWILDLRTNAIRRLTADSGSFGPVASSDDRMRIAYASKPAGRQQGFGIRLLWADSAPASEPLLPPEVNQRPRAFTPDGGALVVQRAHPETKLDIWVVSLDGSGRLEPYLRSPADERGAALSPDGRWMAWVSPGRSGPDEVYAGEFPRLGRPVQVSRDGGRQPRWARSGRALFFRSEEGVMKVEIAGDGPHPIGTPRLLLRDPRFAGSAEGVAYDVHPDGNLFAFVLPAEDRGDLLLRHGWLDALRAQPASR
jgi:DNA-binding SARP family transcriptional activator